MCIKQRENWGVKFSASRISIDVVGVSMSYCTYCDFS